VLGVGQCVLDHDIEEAEQSVVEDRSVVCGGDHDALSADLFEEDQKGVHDASDFSDIVPQPQVCDSLIQARSALSAEHEIAA
jgi:hypothetical protein